MVMGAKQSGWEGHTPVNQTVHTATALFLSAYSECHCVKKRRKFKNRYCYILWDESEWCFTVWLWWFSCVFSLSAGCTPARGQMVFKVRRGVEEMQQTRIARLRAEERNSGMHRSRCGKARVNVWPNHWRPAAPRLLPRPAFNMHMITFQYCSYF